MNGFFYGFAPPSCERERDELTYRQPISFIHQPTAHPSVQQHFTPSPKKLTWTASISSGVGRLRANRAGMGSNVGGVPVAVGLLLAADAATDASNASRLRRLRAVMGWKKGKAVEERERVRVNWSLEAQKMNIKGEQPQC